MKPTLQIRVSEEEARKFIERMQRLGWMPVTESEHPRFTAFRDPDGEMSCHYEVCIDDGEAFIGVRPVSHAELAPRDGAVKVTG